MSRPTKLPDEFLRDAARRGLSPERAADEAGCSVNSVNRRLEEIGGRVYTRRVIVIPGTGREEILPSEDVSSAPAAPGGA